MKDIDWKICVPVGLGLLVTGAVLGAFVVKPALDKAKAKKLAKKKGGENKSKSEGADKS